MLQINHHAKYTNHLSPHKVIAIVLIILLRLYMTSPLHHRDYLFYNWTFISFHPLQLFHPFPPRSSDHTFVLCICESICFVLFARLFCLLDSIYMKLYGICLFLTLFYLPLVQFSCPVMSDSLRPHEPQHARPPCPSPTPGVHPKPCPLSQ